MVSNCQLLTKLQAATVISFSPDTVTFAVLFTEVGFMGQATSRDKCLQLCWVWSGRVRVVECGLYGAIKPTGAICIRYTARARSFALSAVRPYTILDGHSVVLCRACHGLPRNISDTETSPNRARDTPITIVMGKLRRIWFNTIWT